MLRIVATCALLLVAARAHAQASATLTLASDDRYRGVSLSGSRPVLQLDVGVDDAAGDYAGAFASNARLDGHDTLRWQVYGGRAGRFAGGASWDVGLRYTGFANLSGYGYPELYAGIAGRRLGARVAYAWDYFGNRTDALYLGLDGEQPLSTRVRLLGHVGWLRMAGDGDATHASDARAGIAVHVGALDVQLARTLLWTDRRRYRYGYARDGYPVGADALGDAWVVSLSRAW